MIKPVDTWTDNTTKLKISVHSLCNNEDQVKLFLKLIMEDYCMRYNLTNKFPKARVNISFILGSGSEWMDASCSWCDIEELLYIQIWDAIASGEEANKYTMVKSLEILAHEFTHVCQFLTGRNGPTTKPYRGFNSGLHITDFNNNQFINDEYIFSPPEVEARIMELYYYNKFGYVFGDFNEPTIQTIK